MVIEYKEIEKIDWNKVIDLWNENIGSLFPMDNELFYGNLQMGINMDAEYLLGAYEEEKLVGFIIYKEKNTQAATSSDKIGNINSIIVDYRYRNVGIGTKLLNEALKKLEEAKVSKIHVGRDTFHFFPGVPLEALKAMEFFKNRGFEEEDTTWDLISNIEHLNIEEAIKAKGLKLNHEDRYVIEELTKEYEEKTFDFLNETFPGRWHDDLKIIVSYGMELRDIVIIIDKEKDKVIGFSHIYDKKSKYVGPSVYWRKVLGDNFGGLGPIGVSKEYRKLGLGLTLLCKSVEIEKARGVKNMCIDWTGLFDFYGTLNFIPWKGYMHMSTSTEN